MSIDNSNTRTVLVTGASSGIGLECVRQFLAEGHRVIAHVRSESQELASLLSQGELEIVTADLSSKAALNEFTQSELCQRVDILVNNAGTYCYREDFESIKLDEVEEVLRVNLLAPLMLTQAIAPFMAKRKWGRVINISSVSVSHGGAPKSVDYTFSKASLEAMTTTLAKTFTKDNVLINAIRVGFTDTKFNDLNPNKNTEARLKYIPLGRAASPDEIAKVVAFLGSADANYIAGSIIPVTGGEK